MIMYGKRFLNKQMNRATEAKSESRDAILIDADPSSGTCRVKIQGSNEHVIAYFSALRAKSPAWLKNGAAVRITHKGGVRGYVDVVGPGQAIPTGVGSIVPEQTTNPEDVILSGCALQLPMANREAFGSSKGIVWVTVGTYRVNGIVKTLPCITCRAASPLKMKNQPVIGQIAAQFILDRPPQGKYMAGRVMINKVSGQILCKTNVNTEPATPECMSDHLSIGTFLYRYSDGNINEDNLNIEYQKPVPLYCVVDGEMMMPYETENTTITVTVKDQYAHDILSDKNAWQAVVSLVDGTGSVGDNGDKTIYVTSNQGSAQLIFKYHRNKKQTEKKPTIRVSVSGLTGYEEHSIFLLDASGNIIT